MDEQRVRARSRSVSGLVALLCCCSLAESRPCTHRPYVNRLIGMGCPGVAPVPCCTLDHAVLSRRAKLQQSGVHNSLARAVHLLSIDHWCLWYVEKRRSAQHARRKCQNSW